VRQVRVSGTRRFPARDVENVLRTALGSPTITTRAGTLRARVRAVPWVDDATVRVSLDGVVTCAVVERVPVAVAVDAGVRRLVDREGRLLTTVESVSSLLLLTGFAPFPEERETLLAVVPALEQAWGGKLEHAERVGPHDVALSLRGRFTNRSGRPGTNRRNWQERGGCLRRGPPGKRFRSDSTLVFPGVSRSCLRRFHQRRRSSDAGPTDHRRPRRREPSRVGAHRGAIRTRRDGDPGHWTCTFQRDALGAGCPDEARGGGDQGSGRGSGAHGEAPCRKGDRLGGRDLRERPAHAGRDRHGRAGA